jgi:hypothetical protein
MVRAYDGRFLRGLHLRGANTNLMPEVMQKVALLQGRIEEVPGDLDWARQNAVAGKRRSSARLFRQIVDTLLNGFMLRPIAFLIIPSLAMLLLALYLGTWMFIIYFNTYAELVRLHPGVPPTNTLAIAYQQYPQTFVLALLSLILSIQLFGLGLIAFQARRYHDNLFHLGSTIYAWMAEARPGAIVVTDPPPAEVVEERYPT